MFLLFGGDVLGASSRSDAFVSLQTFNRSMQDPKTLNANLPGVASAFDLELTFVAVGRVRMAGAADLPPV